MTGLYNQEVHVLGELGESIAVSIEKARRELGYDPQIDLEEGMRRSIEWCRSMGVEIGARGARAARTVGRCSPGSGLPLSLLAGVAIFGFVVNGHYPVSRWLFWHYLECWVAATFLTAACAAGGDACVRRLLPRLPASERLIGGLSTGLLIFLPRDVRVGGSVAPVRACLLLRLARRNVAGGWARTFCFRETPRASCARAQAPLLGVRRRGRRGAVRPGRARDGLFQHPHARERRVRFSPGITSRSPSTMRRRAASNGFPEGWYQGSLPHLASIVYTWAYLLPASSAFDRVELARTTSSSSSSCGRSCPSPSSFAARRLALFAVTRCLWERARLGRPRSSLLTAWAAAVFLFPGISLYDSSLGAAARPHRCVLGGAHPLLGLARACRPKPQERLVVCRPHGGRSAHEVPGHGTDRFPALAFLGRVSSGSVLRHDPKRASLRFEPLLGLATLAGAALVLTSPHWLKNWIWYGDPIYPLSSIGICTFVPGQSIQGTSSRKFSRGSNSGAPPAPPSSNSKRR